MSGVGQPSSFERAKEFVRKHPDLSKVEAAKLSGLSESTIARARRELIASGEFPASRKARPSGAQAPPTEEAALPREEQPGEAGGGQARQSTMLDHAALTTLAAMADSEIDTLTDEQVQKRLLRQAVSFALDPRLHPDTRMSASQMWAKFKEQTRQRALGPSAPVTFEEAVERMREMMRAVGPDVVLAAVNAEFTVKEPADEGQQGPATGEAPPVAQQA